MSGSGAPTIGINGEGLRVVIVAASWHAVVMDGLIAGAARACHEANAEVTLVRVPGSFELPIVAQECAASGEFDVVVALGATAARAVMHKVVTINANRGRLIELPDHRRAVITVHPSYLLRLLEDRDKRREFDRLVKDLRFAADAARRS